MEESEIFTTDDIKYQDESIVSKIILDKKSGSVTIFAFDKDQFLSEHISPFNAFVYIIEGKAEIKISGEKYDVKINDIIVMPKDIPHSVRAIEKMKMLLYINK